MQMHYLHYPLYIVCRKCLERKSFDESNFQLATRSTPASGDNPHSIWRTCKVQDLDAFFLRHDLCCADGINPFSFVSFEDMQPVAREQPRKWFRKLRETWRVLRS